MSRPVKVDWRVPSDEWSAFTEYVHREHGETKGYVGREVERAMREYIDTDEFAALEAKLDACLRASGRRPVDTNSKKKVTEDAFDESDLARVTCRVDEDTKDSFAAFIKDETDDRLGIGLARALRERRHGGRARRTMEKFDRVESDVMSVMEALGGTAEDGLTNKQEKTIAICNDLGEQFTRDDLKDAIAEHAGDSPPTLKRYTDPVTDRLDVVPHPKNNNLYIPRERAEELAEETGGPSPSDPAIDWKPYSDLSTDEKVRGIQIELIRHAIDTSRPKIQFKTKQIRQDVFNGEPAASSVRAWMSDAADANGFKYRKLSSGSGKALAVDVKQVGRGLLDAAGVLTDGAETDSTEETAPNDDGDDNSGKDATATIDTTDEGERLESASPAG